MVRHVPRRRWSRKDVCVLTWWVGSHPISTLCRMLHRTERAVRCKLHRLGVSARVIEGWSLRQLHTRFGLTRHQIYTALQQGRLRLHTALVSHSVPAAALLPRERITSGCRSTPLEWIAHVLHRSRCEVFNRLRRNQGLIHHLRITEDSLARCYQCHRRRRHPALRRRRSRPA